MTSYVHLCNPQYIVNGETFDLSYTDLTIPEAVNIIMVVHHDQLLELGRNLRLDEYKLGDILSLKHNADEHRQRLIELWFEQEYDPEPQREKLVEALPRRESMDVESPTSERSAAALTPPSEPPCGMICNTNLLFIPRLPGYHRFRTYNHVAMSQNLGSLGDEAIRTFSQCTCSKLCLCMHGSCR